jgi:lysophospholipase L1-like esterase
MPAGSLEPARERRYDRVSLMASSAPPQHETRARDALLSRPALAVATLAAMIAIPYAIPGARRWRMLAPRDSSGASAVPAASDSAAATVGAVRLADETSDRPELALPDRVSIPAGSAGLPPLPAEVRTKAPPRPIEDPSGRALDAFHAALDRVERKQPGALARVLHYGDSLLAIDYVSSTLRRKLQERFGDAGHGYMPIANPWPGYFHNDVARQASTEWLVSRVVGPFATDNLYGLGGVSFTGTSRAAWATYATSTRGTFGKAVSTFAVQYLAQPGGGDLEVVLDGGERETFSTASERAGLATWTKKVPDGAHKFELRVVKGPVRAFGTWMDRDGPGVILDSIGIQGCRLRFLDQSDDAHWAEALRARAPDLVIFEFGLNEAADDFAYPMDKYKETAAKVLEQVRAALPAASCLVVSPNDVAIKRGADLSTRPVVPYLVRAQREVAQQCGCGFFDTYSAMGGFGSMAAWYRRGIGGPDLTHPTVVGADVIGTWLYQALMERYEAHRAGAPGASASVRP